MTTAYAWKRGWARFATLFAGALLPLAYAPYSLFPLALLSLTCLFLLLEEQSPREALLRGWLFGLGMFGVGISWVYISIHEYGDASIAAAVGIALVLVALMAVYPAVAAYVGARFATRNWQRRLLLWPAAWVLAEWFRGWVLTGFPWLNLGYSQVDSPLLGYAPLGGVYGVSWATVLIAGLLAQSWAMRRNGLALTFCLAGLLLIPFAGMVLNSVTWTAPQGKRISVSLLQGNIPQDQKWLPEQMMATVERYAELTRDNQSSQLIIWPETAIPAFYHQVQDSLIPQLEEAAKAWNLDLLIGIPLLDRESWQYYNAVMSLGREHRFYYKQHLVPFGEYMPFRPVLENLLSALDLAMADFSEGAPDQVLLRGMNVPVGVSICYEIAFGEEIIRSLPQAALLVNVSNDGWFGDSLAPHQHLEIARMRARETERTLLRATNTGVSAIIDHKGVVQQRSPQFEIAVLTGKVQPRSGATPYVRVGNLPVVLLASLIVLGVPLLLHRKKWLALLTHRKSE